MSEYFLTSTNQEHWYVIEFWQQYQWKQGKKWLTYLFEPSFPTTDQKTDRNRLHPQNSLPATENDKHLNFKCNLLGGFTLQQHDYLSVTAWWLAAPWKQRIWIVGEWGFSQPEVCVWHNHIMTITPRWHILTRRNSWVTFSVCFGSLSFALGSSAPTIL